MSGVSPEDRDFWGEDLIQASQRWAEPVVQQRTAQLEQRLQQTEAALREQRIVAALDNDPVLKDRWRTVNQSEDFLRWLDQVDDLTGEKRMSHLRRAEYYGNTEVICNLFRGFIIGSMPGRISAAPYENAPRKPAPSGSTKRWRRAEIRAFYENARKGRYSEAEKQRIESEILAAAAASRIADPPLQNDLK